MTAFIPFSGFIVSVLAVAALINSWGTNGALMLMMCWAISFFCKQALVNWLKENKVPKDDFWNTDYPMVWAGLSQDLLALVSVMILTGMANTNA